MPRPWTEHELLIAMNVYCKLPFGRLTQTTPLVVAVAGKLNRTPGSVAMKLCNLASFDPALQARGIKGLRGASQADRRIWDSFAANWLEMSEKSEAAFEGLMQGLPLPGMAPAGLSPDLCTRLSTDFAAELAAPTGPSELEAMVKARRHQRFFRNAVLSSYDYRCAVSGLAVPALLNASHIIPWRDDETRRADPTNGICLNALYDRAFDRGLITFDKDCRLVVSQRLKASKPGGYSGEHFAKREGRKLILPHRFQPDPAALERHQNTVFEKIVA